MNAPRAVALSVVVPTIGRPKLLLACLRSLRACVPEPAEVIVVDQSGGRAVADVVAGLAWPAIRHVIDDRHSIGGALNLGLASAAHTTVAVTHDDCEVAPSWAGTAAVLARRHAGALITGRVLAGAGGTGVVPSTKSTRVRETYRGTLRDNVLYPGNMVLDRCRVQELGGFDERIAPAAEDNDFCYRWLASGLELRYEPELVVTHHDWRTAAQLGSLYSGYARGAGVFYAKHLRRGDLRVLRFLLRDVHDAARAAAAAAVRSDGDRIDPRRGLWTGLPAGLREGWRLYGDGVTRRRVLKRRSSRPSRR